MSEMSFNQAQSKIEGRIIHGDCLEELKKLPNCSVDAVVTDPP